MGGVERITWIRARGWPYVVRITTGSTRTHGQRGNLDCSGIEMKIVYIASPYTRGDVAENVCRQIEAAHKILDMGHCPFAPLLSHFLHLHRQRPYTDWTNMDLCLITKMDVLLRLPGDSPGADAEVREAERLEIPVCNGWQELENWLTSGVSTLRRNARILPSL
jgi:hypothetical protein